MNIRGRVLVIAGSDSGGGAGIQADIKTISALGAYASTAVTALTAQNTRGVKAIHAVPSGFIAEQMTAVLDDIGADCVKTGMLGDAEAIEAIADTLATNAAGIPVVVDPVMVAKGGARLLQDDAVSALKRLLLPKAFVLTPNIPEAEVLTGMTITSAETMRDAANALCEMGPESVYMKGGHLAGDRLVDILVGAAGEDRFESARIDTRHTHGTGCTLASAIAAGIAQGMPLVDACRRAHGFVRKAIENAPGLGSGHGPLNHLLTVGPFRP